MKKEIEIIETLKKLYPDAKCSLDFKTPFQMMVAVVLSAQCTDARVNQVTPEIFEKYPEPKDFADMDIKLLEKLIHSCGFYKTKAKNIKAASEIIVNKYNGVLPNTMEELISLPGVGRKSANVIMLEAFNNPQGIAVDTHAKRISNRLGLVNTKNPYICEKTLMKLFEKAKWGKLHLQLVHFGRYICKAQKPLCDKCPFCEICIYYQQTRHNI